MTEDQREFLMYLKTASVAAADNDDDAIDQADRKLIVSMGLGGGRWQWRLTELGEREVS